MKFVFSYIEYLLAQQIDYTEWLCLIAVILLKLGAKSKNAFDNVEILLPN